MTNLTKIQKQERSNRHWRGYVHRFGLPTPPGTKPRKFVPCVPAWTPPKAIRTGFELFDDFLKRLNDRFSPIIHPPRNLRP
jgi:hypothetical protein